MIKNNNSNLFEVAYADGVGRAVALHVVGAEGGLC